MAKPATAPKPAAGLFPELLGETVIVRTRDSISGQREHAAIVTQVLDDDVVHLTMLPGTGQPYPIASVRHVKNAPAGSLCWRLRSRER